MSLKVEIDNSDDLGFVDLLNALLQNVVATYAPPHIWLIRIDNWFDDKWLKFSGNGVVASNVPLEGWDTVKAEFYLDKITFPPFVPNRVVSQHSYKRDEDDYHEFPLPFLPHRTERQHTNHNLHRPIRGLTGPATFLWFSGRTVENGRGSVMVYTVTSKGSECWFAAFKRDQTTWKLTATKGISRGYVETLFGIAK